VIEADEVIHVGVGDEDVIDLEDHAGRQVANIAQIEKQGFPAVPQIEVQGRVAERVVDKSGTEHGQPLRSCGPETGIQFPVIVPAAVDPLSFFYYGSAGAVKATRQKTLDFHSEKRSYSQLDDPLQHRKDETW
jgi:hypothetical protein